MEWTKYPNTKLEIHEAKSITLAAKSIQQVKSQGMELCLTFTSF